jgi:hypothetical protein
VITISIKHCPFIPNDLTEQQKAESIERRQRQIRLARGENCTEQQQTSYQMLTVWLSFSIISAGIGWQPA